MKGFKVGDRVEFKVTSSRGGRLITMRGVYVGGSGDRVEIALDEKSWADFEFQSPWYKGARSRFKERYLVAAGIRKIA